MKRACFTLLMIWLLASGLPWAARAADFDGRCVGITDGDTIQVMHDGRVDKIRLDGIDAPESHQAFGTVAKKALSDLVFGKNVHVKDKGKDRYGRTLGVVIQPPNDSDVNAVLVRNGYAWHYKQYSKDLTLAKYEILARQAKLGLWKDPAPIPPWDFRRGRTTGSQATLQTAPTTALTSSTTHNIAAPTQTVYTTNSGTKYHRSGCRYLSKSAIPVPLDKAVEKYSPCSVCNPPRLGTK